MTTRSLDAAPHHGVRGRQIRELIRLAVRQGRHSLDEAEGKSLLAAYGIETPLGKVVDTAEQAARVAEALGGAVVLKALGPDIQHKSDRGLVMLGVQGPAAVKAAYHRIVDLGAGRVAGVLVEQMVQHEREFLVGMRRDERFGPVVAFGLGGVFTEALQDVALALAPLDQDDALRLVAGLRAQRMLSALRGLPKVDVAELVRILQAVGRMADDHAEIAEIDINPLAVAGRSVMALDALVVLAVPQDELEQTARPIRPAHLDAVFAPRSVAIVGASADVNKWGGSLLKNIVDGGFAGRVYPVNPRGGTCIGLPAYESLDAVPQTPDLVFVVLGAEHSEAVVERCAKLGVKAAVVIAAGYSEAGDEGSAMERALARTAQESGLTLVGPNCMGVIASSVRLNAVGFVTLRPEAGSISVVSQSGNIGTQILMTAERRGLGIEKFISIGNQVATTGVDVLDFLTDDPRTDAVLMYVEELADGRRFFEVARRAATTKPVIVVHGGSTSAGSRAASSHTGALAGSAEVFMAAARQAGVIVCDDPDESLDVASCLVSLPLPAGRRVGVVTLGGGWGVLTADALSRAGLRLAELPMPDVGQIDELLPSFWSHGNPVDLVASVAGETPQKVLEIVANSDAVDAVLALALVGSPSSGRAGQNVADDPSDCRDGLNEAERSLLACIARLMEQTVKPIIAVPLCPVTRTLFQTAAPYPPLLLPTPAAAVRALAHMVEYAEYRERGTAMQRDGHKAALGAVG